jgi:hypothetical protein
MTLFSEKICYLRKKVNVFQTECLKGERPIYFTIPLSLEPKKKKKGLFIPSIKAL